MVLEGHWQVCCSGQQTTAPIMSLLFTDKASLLFLDVVA